MVEQQGKHRFIDRVEVRFLPSENKYWAAMDNFGFTRIHIPDEFYRRYDRLLEGGIWAHRRRRVQAAEEGTKGSPFHIADLKPIQLARFDFEEYCDGRRAVHHATSGSTCCCAASAWSPTRIETRLKLLLLTRLIPFVEKNYNFIELGPRGTGKSYAFSEMSPVLHPHLGRQGEHGEPLLQQRPPAGGPGRPLGRGGLRRGRRHEGHRPRRHPDHEGLHGERAVQPRRHAGPRRRLARLRRQPEPAGRDAGRATAATDLFQPLPKEFDLAVIDRLPLLPAGLGDPEELQDILTTSYGFVTDYLAEAFRHAAQAEPLRRS